MAFKYFLRNKKIPKGNEEITNYKKKNRQKESLLQFIYHGIRPERWQRDRCSRRIVLKALQLRHFNFKQKYLTLKSQKLPV